MVVKVWTFFNDWSFGIRVVKPDWGHQIVIQFLCFWFIIKNESECEKAFNKKVKK